MSIACSSPGRPLPAPPSGFPPTATPLRPSLSPPHLAALHQKHVTPLVSFYSSSAEYQTVTNRLYVWQINLGLWKKRLPWISTECRALQAPPGRLFRQTHRQEHSGTLTGAVSPGLGRGLLGTPPLMGRSPHSWATVVTSTVRGTDDGSTMTASPQIISTNQSH